MENREILLKVRNLEQHFKMGKRTNRAVDNISFDIYKGEVLGLVGESGCGKTTTGRSIIRLYDATSGSVYFKDVRICAGIGAYVREIKASKKELDLLKKACRNEVKKVKAENKGQDKIKVEEEVKKVTAKYEKPISDKENEHLEVVRKNTDLINKAKFDHKNCNKVYALQKVGEIKKEYEPKINAETNPERKASLVKDYKAKLRVAKRERIINKIQMIFQDPIASLDPRMTVSEIISEGLIVKGIKDKEFIQQEVFRMLKLVGLVPEHASRYPHEFSGGQRQRIGIARAIILNPELIIADEPISALDVSIQAQVINLLNELRDKMGLTTLFIAHDLSVVKYFSDRIAVMYYGKIVELAKADELFKNPLHPYTKSLFSAIPVPDPTFEKNRKRITYNPLVEHDYSKERPTMQEVKEGHFIFCNSAELEKYKNELK